jgi:hypothetical protein
LLVVSGTALDLLDWRARMGNESMHLQFQNSTVDLKNNSLHNLISKEKALPVNDDKKLNA